MFSNAFRGVRRLVFLSLPRANKEPAEVGMGWRSVYVYYFAARGARAREPSDP
jgi:hypothetical protein